MLDASQLKSMKDDENETCNLMNLFKSSSMKTQFLTLISRLTWKLLLRFDIKKFESCHLKNSQQTELENLFLTDVTWKPSLHWKSKLHAWKLVPVNFKNNASNLIIDQIKKHQCNYAHDCSCASILLLLKLVENVADNCIVGANSLIFCYDWFV